MGHYPLLFYTALTGAGLLLVIELLSPLHSLRKPITAIWLTAMTLLWVALPVLERWVLSTWAPAIVLEGQILLQMTPVVWWCGFALGAAFSGTAWIEVVERREALPLAGALVLVALPVIWVALASATLLTTLAAWAVFDLLWGGAGLMSGARGERITFNMALHGVSSIILWLVSLLLHQEGESTLWWLMWPSSSVLWLLLVSALIRVGFYPFQIVFPNRVVRPSTLSLVYLVGPVSGVALLYRIMMLPGVTSLPASLPLWGVVSVFWIGLMAWASKGQRAVLWAERALLNAMVAGAIVMDGAAFLMLGAALWIGAVALFLLVRGRDAWGIGWSWPAWLALFFILGVPPSPAGELYAVALQGVPWFWRLLFLTGFGCAGAVLLKMLVRPGLGRSALPWAWLRVGFAVGVLSVLVGVVGSAVVVTTLPLDRVYLLFETQSRFVPLLGWGSALFLSVALVRWGGALRKGANSAMAFFEMLDLQWLYRALWRGAEHLLGLLRVSAEVFEGSGAVVWSLLVMLLILLVGANR